MPQARVTALDVAILIAAPILTYFTLRWALDSLDPTRRKKPASLPGFVVQRLRDNKCTLDEHELVIASEIVDPSTLTTGWNDIGGLASVVDSLKEVVVLPFTRPDIFGGRSRLLQPPRGILLYGPPGCGKTMLAKAIAKESECTFINLKVSTLTEKWYGESQKLVNAVFSLAVKMQPTIIFIDEIDSLLRERQANDHEATAMMKTQFMSLWDGLSSDSHCRVIIVGATNRPQDVDRAILRRMPRTFRIGLPDSNQREAILRLLLASEAVSEDFDYAGVSALTEEFSGSDLKELCRLAVMEPVREYLRREKETGGPQFGVSVRALETRDFVSAKNELRSSAYGDVQTEPEFREDVDDVQ